MGTFTPIYILLHVDYFIKDFHTHLRRHEQAEEWAKERNIKFEPGPAYTLTTIFEFTNVEDLLAFTLAFGDLFGAIIE